MTAAAIVELILLAYLGLGLIFGIAFLLLALRRLDQAATAAPLFVKLAWLPGCMALWPLLLAEWVTSRPPEDTRLEVEI